MRINQPILEGGVAPKPITTNTTTTPLQICNLNSLVGVNPCNACSPTKRRPIACPLQLQIYYIYDIHQPGVCLRVKQAGSKDASGGGLLESFDHTWILF